MMILYFVIITIEEESTIIILLIKALRLIINIKMNEYKLIKSVKFSRVIKVAI